MKRYLGISILASLLLSAAAGGQPIPLGPPVQVNSAASSVDLGAPSVSSNAAGGFVVAWSSRFSTYWRFYHRTSTPRGPESQVGAPVSDPLDVSAGPQGSFVLVWSENGERISSRRFRVDGTPLGGILQVSAPQEGFQGAPAVARIPATGGHVVVWPSVEENPWGVDVVARRYDQNGQPLAPELRTHQIRRLSQTMPDVAALPDGGYVVVWQTNDISGIPLRGIFARFFDRNGRPRGQEVRVDSGAGGAQLNPSVAVASETGQAVIVWESLDESGLGIFSRRFDALGNPVGSEIQVNTDVFFHQMSPAVAMSPQGDFIVAWASANEAPETSEIRARWFSRDGIPSGESFQVDAGPGSHLPAVAMDGSGDFTIVWLASEGLLPPSKVMARRYTPNPPDWTFPAR